MPAKINFTCPDCGEKMEIGETKAGQFVDCVACGKEVRVPRAVKLVRAGLSTTEWVLYTLLFLLIPIANVIVSSVLYYVWRSSSPRKANQINLLGFAIFGLHVASYVLFYVVLFYVVLKR